MTLHEQLWEQLLGIDPVDTAKRTKCEYCDDSKRFTIRFLGSEYAVDIDEKRVFMRSDDGDGADAQYLEQLCILTYLINCSDASLAGKLVTADKLEAGQFFFRGPHVLPTDKLEEVFGHDPASIYSAATVLGAKKASYGDASIEVFVLPRLPITFVIWGSDEEFDARASILFDKTAPEQLPLDALLAAVNLASKALISAIG
jgi:hypothetical protein